MVTRNQKIILAGAGVGAVIIGAAAVAMAKKGPPPSQYTIALTSSSPDVQTGQSVDFTALVADANGIPQGNTPVSVLESGSAVASGVTDSAGSYAFSLGFANAGTFPVQVTSGRLQSNVVVVTATVSPPPPPQGCPSTVQLQLANGGTGVAALLPAASSFQLMQAAGCEPGFNPSFWAMWAAGDYSEMPALYDCGTDSFEDIANIPAIQGCSWGPLNCGVPHRYITLCGWTYSSTGSCVTG